MVKLGATARGPPVTGGADDVGPSQLSMASRSETVGQAQPTMSFRPLSGRILTTLRAGLAANTVSSPVNGLIPLRSLVAGCAGP